MRALCPPKVVTAAATGRLSLGEHDPTVTATVSWLAIGRITFLEIFIVHDIALCGNGAQDREIDIPIAHDLQGGVVKATEFNNRIEALVAIPTGVPGSGAADSLLLVDDNFSWKLLSLRAHSSGSITTEIRDKEIKLDMTTLASGVFRQHPHSFRATSLAETSRMIHLFTCASQNLFQVEHGLKPQNHFAAAGGIHGDTLTLLAFRCLHGPEWVDRVEATQVEFELTPQILLSSLTHAQGAAGQRRDPSSALDTSADTDSFALSVLDAAFLDDLHGRSSGNYTIAVIVGKSRPDSASGNICERRKVQIRTYCWDTNSSGSCVRPGIWCIEDVHPGTRIAAIPGGGLLCAGPDGVRVFGSGGQPLPRADANFGDNDRPRMRCAGTGTWGCRQLSALTAAVTEEWKRAFQMPDADNEGETQDFLVADVDGGLHRIRYTIHGVGYRSAARTTCGSRRFHDSSSVSIDCTQIRFRDGAEISTIRSPPGARILLGTSCNGLVFAAGAFSLPFAWLGRLGLHPTSQVPVNSRDSRSATIPLTCEPAAQRRRAWKIIAGQEFPARSPGPVSDFALLEQLNCGGPEEVVALHYRRDSEFLNRPSVRAGAVGGPCKTGASSSIPCMQMNTVGNLRSVVATGSTHGQLGVPSLGMLQRGLGLNVSSQGYTGIPEGSVLFAQPLTVGSRAGTFVQRQRAATVALGEDVHRLSINQAGHVMLFSDRVRLQTRVMLVSPEGDAEPAPSDVVKGFDCNSPTVHLGRLEPSGLLVQVTESRIVVFQPTGLTIVGSRNLDPFPKVQFGATAGEIIAIASEKTLAFLSIEVIAAEEMRAQKCTVQVQEILRVELSSATSALDATFLRGNKSNEQSSVGIQEAVIAIGSWDTPPVTIFLWAHKTPGDCIDAGRLTRQTLTLEEVATWHPHYTTSISEGSHPSSAWVSAAAPMPEPLWSTPIRALAFFRPEHGSDKLSLVAAGADGIVAVTDLEGVEKGCGMKVRVQDREGCRQEKLDTCASIRVGRAPVGLEVVHTPHRPGKQCGGERGHDQSSETGEGREEAVELVAGEGVLISGEVDAILVSSPSSTKNTAGEPQSKRWYCFQVCRTNPFPRRSIVRLRNVNERERVNSNSTFAWLTSSQSSANDFGGEIIFPGESGARAGEDVLGDNQAAGGGGGSGQRGMVLCFGSLAWETRTRWYQKSLKENPTHLVYLPASRSVVVACRENGSPVDSPAREPGGVHHSGDNDDSTCDHLVSSTLRVFDAETLEERYMDGCPVRLRPGVMITALTQIGLDPSTRLAYRRVAASTLEGSMTSARRPLALAGAAGNKPLHDAAAVGGDAIAVACCSENADLGDRAQEPGTKWPDDARSSFVSSVSTVATLPRDVQSQATGTDSPSEDPEGSPLATTIAAFEVISCRNPRDTLTSCSDAQTVGGLKESEAVSRDHDAYISETSLEPLTASGEVSGACFCLEALGGHLVVAAIDDKLVVFGLMGITKDQPSPDRRTPLLGLRSIAWCRATSGGCITALATHRGEFIAVAEFLGSVSLYRFDRTTRRLSVAAVYSRTNLMVDALGLASTRAPTGVVSQENNPVDIVDDASTRFPSVFVADRTTGTIARLTYPCQSYPLSAGGGHYASARCEADFTMKSRETEAADGEDGRPVVPVLRVVFVWRCPETVSCLRPTAPMSSTCSGDSEDDFIIGTAEGAIRTLRATS